MSEYLSKRDLIMLSGYEKPSKQADWLKSFGIPYRADGCRVIVTYRHVSDWIEGKTVSFGEVNFGAIR